MKIFLYIRLSNADKDLKFKSESESIANQRALLHQYLEKHKEFHPYTVEEFIDDGYSGTNADRPAFERMMDALKDGKSKLVLCKDLSRFFRDYVEIGDYLERVFPFLGVRFIAVNDAYDSDNYIGTTGGMDVVMKCIVYSFYSRDLSQKIKTVLSAKKKKGQFIGSYAPYGYLKDPDDKHHLIPDPIASKVVRRMYELAIQGNTTGEIAKILNRDNVEPPASHFHRLYPDSKKFQKTTTKANSWTCMNVSQILLRKEYTGAVVSQKRNYKNLDTPVSSKRKMEDWLIVPDCHERFISDEEYKFVQQILKTGKKTGNRKRQNYLLRSLVRCGTCGRTMVRVKKGVYTECFYKCDKNRYIEDSPCPLGERFYEADLEKIVVGSLSRILQVVVDEGKRIQEAATKTKGTADNIKRNILKLESAVKAKSLERMIAYERYTDGAMERVDFKVLSERIAQEVQQLEQEKAQLQTELAKLETELFSQGDGTAKSAEEFLKAENVTNEMLLAFIDRVYVYSGMRVEIVYRFSDPFAQTIAEQQAINE